MKPTTLLRDAWRRLTSRFPRGGRRIGETLYGRGVLEAEPAIARATTGLPTARQFRFLARVMSWQEWRVGAVLLLLVLTSGGLLTWRWVERHTELVPQPGGEYSEAVVGNPRTTNPLLASIDPDLDLAALTTRGLTATTGDGTTVPDVAEAWTVSPDQKTYTVTLKPNLRWSDGQPVTADDITFTYQSVQDPALSSPQQASFRGVTVKQADARTVTFTLKEPYPQFPAALGLGLVPIHVWQNVAPDHWTLAEANLKSVGLGPYRFRSLTKDPQGSIRTIVLERNPYTHTQQPYLDKITLRFYPDSVSALEALKQGAVDGATGAAAELSSRRYQTYDLPLPQYTAVFLNPQANLALKDRGVRQALSLAVNRPDLIQEALSGAATPAGGPFVANELRATAAMLAYDADRAAELLKAAGFARDADGTLKKGGQPLSLTLTYVDTDEYLQVAQALERQWGALGLTVTLEGVASYRLNRDVLVQRTYEALLTTEVVGLDPDPYPFWHSSQVAAPGLNLAQFQNREADQLLAEARQTTDHATRLDKYRRFQEITSQESPAVFLYSKGYRYTVQGSIHGITATPVGQPAERWQNVGTWYRKTDHRWLKQ